MMIGIDQENFSYSVSLDQYISTKIDQYKDREHLWRSLDGNGVDSFWCDKAIDGVNHILMLKRWMEVIYPFDLGS